jgi:hypothetical protein
MPWMATPLGSTKRPAIVALGLTSSGTTRTSSRSSEGNGTTRSGGAANVSGTQTSIAFAPSGQFSSVNLPAASVRDVTYHSPFRLASMTWIDQPSSGAPDSSSKVPAARSEADKRTFHCVVSPATIKSSALVSRPNSIFASAWTVPAGSPLRW